MMPIYEHRQSGLVITLLLAAPVTVLLVAISLTARQAPTLLFLIPFAAFMVGAIILFSSLTVTVDSRRVALFFGPGFPSAAFPLSEIAGVRVVRNALWMGLGIHFIPGGMVYNVSGLDAVELTLRSGRVARIGTDEPTALARAIEGMLRR